MKKILCMTVIFLSLTVCSATSGWAEDTSDFVTGIAACRRGDYDDAIKLLTKAIKSDEFSGDDLATIHMYRGFSWEGKGNLNKALDDYSKAIELNPRDTAAYTLRGVAWVRKAEYDKAIADYTKAIEITPKFAKAYNNRGYTWARKGNMNEAIADYTKAIEIDPNYVMAYANRGTAWADKGEYDKAIADFDKALEIDPSYIEVRENRQKALDAKERAKGR
jgi:tetratricopeptide (TPR) repeat protein